MRQTSNVAEKERLKRQEEESRKRQIFYEMQVNDKRSEIKREFELHSLDTEAHQNPSKLANTLGNCEFKKELDRLVTYNAQKKLSLQRLQAKEQSDVFTERTPERSDSKVNKINIKQENISPLNKSSKYSRQVFSQSFYRSASLQFIGQQMSGDSDRLQERIKQVKYLVQESEQNIANESERYETIKQMEQEMSSYILGQNQFNKKVQHLNRMNEIADTRYRDINHIDVQANENKRVINSNVQQVKEQASEVEGLYKEYRDKKSAISQQLKSENEQDEYFISNVQIKIEDYNKQNEELEAEIAALDEMKLQRERREQESFFTGLYLWAFRRIEKFVKKVEESEEKNHEIDIESERSCLISEQNEDGEYNILNEKLSISSGTPISISKNKRIKENPFGNSFEDHILQTHNFDRNVLIEKIECFYAEHKGNIEQLVSKMLKFHESQVMHCLLMQNRSVELISQKTKFTQELEDLNLEIEQIKKLNFFLEGNTNLKVHPDTEKVDLSSISSSPSHKNTKKLKSQQQISVVAQQKVLKDIVSPSKLQIVNNFLEQETAMDSGIIFKKNPQTSKDQPSTINVESFLNQHRETEKNQMVIEKQQKFIFQCYLSLVELVMRFCLIVPLIDLKLEQIQQKMNIFFEFESIPPQLLKSCSVLFAIATNGKSLEREFLKIAEQGNAGVQQSLSKRFNGFNQNAVSPNYRNSIQIGLISQLSAASNQFTPMAYSKKNQQTQQYSYLNQEEDKNMKSGTLIKLLQIDEEGQISQDKDKSENIIEQIMKDKMAKYLLTPQFVKSFVEKQLEIQQDKFKIDNILVKIKGEALNILDDKISQILKHFSQVYDQIDSYISSLQKNFASKNLDVRVLTLGSNHPPQVGGALSLPPSDYIQASYAKAYEKQRTYQRNEEEDCIQKLSRQPQPISDGNPLLKSMANKQAQEEFQKNAIYKFIHEISNLKKNKMNQTSSQQSPQIIQQLNNQTLQPSQSTPILISAQQMNNNQQPISGQSALPLSQNNQITSNNLKDSDKQQSVTNQQGQDASLLISSNVTNSAQMTSPQGQTQQASLTKFSEDDFIEEERTYLKNKELKEFEEFKYKDIRAMETKMQEDKKKRLVYHRLIENAETPNSRQEQSAIKQFSIDQDILFKIHNRIFHIILGNYLLEILLVENSVDTDTAGGVRQSIQSENNKISTKYAKEFATLSYGYLKTNKIYNVRKELNIKDRNLLKEQEIQLKYFLMNKSQTFMKIKDQSQENVTQGKSQNISQDSYSHRKSNLLSLGKRLDLAKIQNQGISSTGSSYRPSTTQLTWTSKKLERKKSDQFNQSWNSPNKPKNLFISSEYKGGLTQQQFDEFSNSVFSPKKNNLQNNSSILVPTSASSTGMPVHYKYLFPESNLEPSNLLSGVFFTKIQKDENRTNSSRVYINNSQLVERKAYTSQSGQRKHLHTVEKMN